MNTLLEIKAKAKIPITTYGLPYSERSIRRFLSNKRREGCIYIRVSKKTYNHVENCSHEEIEHYVRTQLNHIRTQYFNTLKPLQKYVEDEKLKELMGVLENV